MRQSTATKHSTTDVLDLIGVLERRTMKKAKRRKPAKGKSAPVSAAWAYAIKLSKLLAEAA
jgi:hypothetical protein